MPFNSGVYHLADNSHQEDATTTTLNQSPGGDRNPGATREREERVTALTEANSAALGATPERRLGRLPTVGPRVSSDVTHPPVCMGATPGSVDYANNSTENSDEDDSASEQGIQTFYFYEIYIVL